MKEIDVLIQIWQGIQTQTFELGVAIGLMIVILIISNWGRDV